MKIATANAGHYKAGDRITDEQYKKLPNMLKVNFKPFIYDRSKFSALKNTTNNNNQKQR